MTVGQTRFEYRVLGRTAVMRSGVHASLLLDSRLTDRGPDTRNGVARPLRPGASYRSLFAMTRAPSRPTRSTANGRRIAAIDIGSNSIRQIVADVSAEGSITVVDEMKAAPRLGADVDVTGVLGTQAMQLAAEAIGRMATLARQLGAERIEAVATSAVRDAANRDQFVARGRQ